MKKVINTQELKKLHRRHRGYALLFAVLVSSVVLAVGVSILNISRKELLLTTGAEQSQYAFYAADTGYECALYQDYQNNSFVSTSTGNGVFTVNCGATYTGSVPAIYPSPVAVTLNTIGLNTSQYVYSFNFQVSNAGSCVAVTVTKTYTTVTVGTTTSTTASTSVLSDGFNTGWEASPGDCNAPSNSKVERALLASY
jgi:hypothetical protein